MKWHDIYLHLKSKGIEIYSQGQKTDTCQSNYVVLKDNGQYGIAGSYKTGYSLIDVIIFCPINKYSQVEGYKTELKGYMKELQGIKPTGNETPVIIDDSVKAYTTSIEYQILKRL